MYPPNLAGGATPTGALLATPAITANPAQLSLAAAALRTE
ncbi:MAG: hypothetical protein RLZZ355_154 [Pseudomonadota bacterium]|jgi:hypothetical protein